MREILFRGKRVDNGEWVYGLLCRVGNTYANIRRMDTKVLYSVLTNTIGQFTGLTDKNGRKIFEGDILKIYPDCDYCEDYSISTVYSYNGVLCVDYRGDDFDSTALGFINDVNDDADFEIIGNIYDNPELVGGESDG